MSKDIPVYSKSYSPEENQKLHEYIESASNKDLVELIFKLSDLYPDDECQQIIRVLTDFSKEIIQRCQMDERYEKLEGCISEWSKYFTALNTKAIQKAYTDYKALAQHKKELKATVDGFLGYKAKELKPYDFERGTIQQLLSPKMYKEMEKLSVPEIRYYTLEEIPVREYTIGEGLEQLDRNNLNYILRGLLQYVDSPDEKNIPVAALTMLTRKYSASRSHKKGTLKSQALFSTPTYTYKELSDKCKVLLGQLISIIKSCDDFIAPI